MAVTELQAMDCLKYHINNRVIKSLPATVNLNQNQVDALCSFIYNIGAEGFKKSTLFKDIIKNADAEIIRTDFMMWVKSGGMLVKGLVTRRKAEAALFLS